MTDPVQRRFGPAPKHTAQEIIDAYQLTGSVWRAGKELGLAGQTVHERLRSLGYQLAGSKWSNDEIAELRQLVGVETIAQIATRLGRPYSGVAGKISELKIGSNSGNRRPIKLPRGAGYDKVTTVKHAKAIDSSGLTVHRYARSNGLGVEFLCSALERHVPEWWATYRAANSDMPETGCEYCGRRFVPSNAKQRFCTRKCGADSRADRGYFGGNRRSAIGWAEGTCQICERQPKKGLTPHHVLGKENDPADAYLVAVCQGCHQVVTALGGRDFTEQQWEALISLAWLRRHGPDVATGWDKELTVCVDIDVDPHDEGDAA